MKRLQRKGYYELEKRLKKQYRHIRENELILTEEDFADGHLKDSGFIRLKEESWYIPYHDKIVIRLPKIPHKNFQEDLGFYAVRALSKIRNDRQNALYQSIALILVGAFILSILAFLWEWLDNVANIHLSVFSIEFITIVSWVFIWSGVSRWFIDQRDLQDKRFTILQLLSAQIL